MTLRHSPFLKPLTYKYQDGPLSQEELEKGDYTTANCRRAIQHCLFHQYGKCLSPQDILLPYAYKSVGIFVTNNGQVTISLYKPGNIMYAERIKDKNGKVVSRHRDLFQSEDEWIYHFHSAIYLGDNHIFHSTAVVGTTCIWDLSKFQEYYRIIAVKRVII